jgi:hypothetical protein
MAEREKHPKAPGRVEIARQFADCWARSDWDRMAELADPQVG